MQKLIVLLIQILSFLPLWLLHAISWLTYLLLFHVFKVRRALALKNIKTSFPENSNSECFKLAKNHYKNVCQVLAESIKGLSLSKSQIKRRVKFNNIDLLKSYLDNNQSVIIAGAHYCNIDWALLSCAQQVDYPMDAVYREQRSEWLEIFFYKLRSRFGVYPIPMKSFITESMKRGKITRMVGMAADQSPKVDDSPYWQLFMNQETAFHTGTEKFARAFKYPILFMSMKRIRAGYYEVTLNLLAEPPYSDHEPNYILKKYISELENMISNNPSDWLWAYRRWKLKKPADD